MSCCNPRNTKIILQCSSDSEGSSTYTFSNANLTGQGVFISEVDGAVTFRGVASADGSVTITADATNKTVDLSVNTSAVVAAIPDATTSVKGKLETATDAEALAKSSTTVAVTPSNFAAMAATTGFAGLVELATVAEAQAGTSSTLAVTPEGVKAVVDTLPYPAIFADAAARSVAVPSVVGQIGVQQDTQATYVAYGTTAGQWLQRWVTVGSVTDIFADTDITIGAGDLNFTNPDGTAKAVTFSGDGMLRFDSGGVMDLGAGSEFRIAGVAAPADSVVISDNIDGTLSSMPIADFISNRNLSTAYSPTNYTALRAFDAGTVTVGDLARVVATMLQDQSAGLMYNVT